MLKNTKKVVVIGSGFGGLAVAIRLQAMGFEVEIVEKNSKPGGRGMQDVVELPGIGKFKFDLGPTVLTVPYFYEELFALQKGENQFEKDNIPEKLIPTKPDKTFTALEVQEFKNLNKYVDFMSIMPFYRIYFADGTFFDYDGIYTNTIKQITELCGPEEAKNYDHFLEDSFKVFQEAFLKIGFDYFATPFDLLKVLPKMLKLKSIRSLYKYVFKYFKHQKMREIFSFEPLLIGGNPVTVPALYVIIHFVEKTWGVFYTRGGTGSLVNALVKKFLELGGKITLQAEVKKILIKRMKASGVLLKSGEEIIADLVVANTDYHHLYNHLLPYPKLNNSSFKTNQLTTYTNSLMVLYFAFKKENYQDLGENLRHHNIVLGGSYLKEMDGIYKDGKTVENFSQYLHLPSITDPSLCPSGYHIAYTLVVLPNEKIKKYTDHEKEELVEKILDSLDNEKFIPNLRQRLVYKKYRSQEYFRQDLNSVYGNAFGVSPVFHQSAYLRPHNQSADFGNLYTVGASFQPGAGTPSVLMSAKMTAKLIAKKFAKN